jgi:DNA invertase Pin-like site-specific DNA recombinase
MKTTVVGYGFAKTSDPDAQERVDSQRQRLLAAGASQIYSEIDHRRGERTQLKALMEMVVAQEVSEVVVTSLDRFTRSLVDLVGLTSAFEQAGVKLRVLDSNIDDYASTKGQLSSRICDLLGDTSQGADELRRKIKS